MNDEDMSTARNFDSVALLDLRKRFEQSSEALAATLVVINEFLATGIATNGLSDAFSAAPDHMNECRYLINQIEDITRDAERPTPRRTKK